MAAPQPDAPHRPLQEFYADPRERASYINRLFNNSAPHYDWISKVLAFGSDKYYRRMALRKAGLKPGMKLLDVASGTGLVAQAALDIGLPVGSIIGLDPSIGMLSENQKLRPIHLIQGLGENLPFPDGTFDFITMGYALRHVESLAALFTEFKRVLKPGGKVLILEISKPSGRVSFAFLRFYMEKILPLIARLRTNHPDFPELLRYYWATIAECVPPQKIQDTLRAAGFPQVNRNAFGPMLNDYLAVKGS
jgi:demethylmenaquinone methyltransferase / 2-methoxy-6-polyprenyl-1,4-benzoquinol methylase